MAVVVISRSHGSISNIDISRVNYSRFSGGHE